MRLYLGDDVHPAKTKLFKSTKEDSSAGEAAQSTPSTTKMSPSVPGDDRVPTINDRETVEEAPSQSQAAQSTTSTTRLLPSLPGDDRVPNSPRQVAQSTQCTESSATLSGSVTGDNEVSIEQQRKTSDQSNQSTESESSSKLPDSVSDDEA